MIYELGVFNTDYEKDFNFIEKVFIYDLPLKENIWNPFKIDEGFSCKNQKYENINKYIKSKNGDLIDIYKQSSKNEKNYGRFIVEYTCKEGHLNKEQFSDLQIKFCQICDKMTIDDVRKAAKNIGWECLSDVYISPKHNCKFKCNKGHIFEMKCSYITNGKPCPECKTGVDDLYFIGQEYEVYPQDFIEKAYIPTFNNKRYIKADFKIEVPIVEICKVELIEEAQTYLEKIGWNFIYMYRRYTTYDSKLMIICSCINNHIITKQFRNKRGCTECMKNGVDTCIALAKTLGWRFLSDTYVNNSTIYNWECNNKHIIQMAYNSVGKRGCVVCLGRKQQPFKEHTLETLQQKAKEKGGKCLSVIFRSINDSYQFICNNNHTWTACGSDIMRDSWCIQCNSNVQERTCRKIMEYIYKEPFPKERPDWLTNDDGHRLELDIYNDKLKIALEYQGAQHFKMMSFFDKSPEDYDKRVKNDAQKVKVCKDRDIHLIITTYIVISKKGVLTYLITHPIK
jgi:hypothetical protein